MAVAPSLITIDPSRDAKLNDFTIQTLKERYLLPGETSPQHGFARACAAFADDQAHAQRLYDYVSRGWFMFATPLLSNGGSERGLPISCFLTAVEDSRESISAHYDEVIWLSSMGGGIGSYWGELRSADETTSKGSKSTGMMPFAAVDDRLILAVSQGGTRRGSNAAYLDVHHPEVEEFLTARKQSGGDSNRKIINLHQGLNITDEFMLAVKANGPFHLRSPKDGSIRKTVKARDLWKLILETRKQTGEPYLHFIDTSNRAFPPQQKALGLRIKQSNLCVSGETEILTRDGHLPIAALVDQEVEAWNGEAFSTVTIRQTAASAELVRVWFEDGGHLDCTPEHNFYLAGGAVVPAAALKPGARLEQDQSNLPLVGVGMPGSLALNCAAYTAGWATFAGFEDANRLAVHCPEAAGDDVLRRLVRHSVDLEADNGGSLIRYEPSTIQAGFVPMTWSVQQKLAWLGGAFDAASEWVDLGPEDHWLSVSSTNATLIAQMRRLALESGLEPRIRITDTLSVFMLPASDITRLADGLHLLRNLGPCISELGMIKVGGSLRKGQVVADIQPLPWRAPTYCATEPLRGRLTFNGYITGNCSEIMLGTGRDIFDRKRTAVCCLSSVCAETFDEWRDDPVFLEDMFRLLDNALQVFIDNAPEQMRDAVYSAMRERSVGLGLLGFHSYLQQKNVAFESDEARAINMRIFQHLRRQANAISLKLGAERGEAPDMAGTGERFAHKLASAPNASSAIIIPTPMGSGTSPSIEPIRANAYLHKTLSGSFPVLNPYLKARLAELGRDTDETWQSIIANEGSVQHLDFLTEHDKAVYRTAMEINQRAVVRLAGDRAPSICQGQSINIFLPHDVDAEELTQVHWMAWEVGVKSLYYLRSTTPHRAENTNTKIERVIVDEVAPDEEPCFACQG